MKKILSFLVTIIGLVLIVPSCEIDNFPYPDSQVYGSIRDSIGGALVETDIQNGSSIGVYELGPVGTEEQRFSNPVLQNWVIKNNGEYRNNFVYSARYNIEFQSCNFFPYTLNGIDIFPGPNEQNFNVVPFIRIKNCSITHDAASNKIIATFNLEAGKPSVKVSKITLYAFTDIYVGEYVKYSLSIGTGTPSRSFNPAETIDPETIYTLSIDLAVNATRFAIHRDYYFRVGALANQAGVGTIRTNYAPYVVIRL